MESIPNPQISSEHSQPDAPDVSVIIPVFNCERYLWETMDSVFSQEIHPSKLEIIAVDDGSTDASLAILQSMALRHSNIIVRSIANSGSASAPRNEGLDIATGRYVFFLDADDQIEPDTLRVLVQLADETGSGVVLCKMGPAGPGKRAEPLPSRGFVRDRFAEDFIDSKAYTTLSPTKLFRRSLLEEHHIRFPLGYRIGEDQPFTMAAYVVSPHISVLCNKVYYRAYGREDGTNVTSQPQSPQKHLIKNMRLIEAILKGDLEGERLNKLLERPILGRGGLRLTFGKRFASSFGKREKESSVRDTRNLIQHLWTPELRSLGTAEPQVLIDLLTRGDVDGLEKASQSLEQTGALPLEFDRQKSEFVYRPPSGGVIDSLNVEVISRLSEVDCTSSSVSVYGEVGLLGGDTAPESVQLTWVHRKTGAEKSIEMLVEDSYTAVDGERALVRAESELHLFDACGNWDAFIVPRWGALSLSLRWGKVKDSSVTTSPSVLGHPARAAVVYTKHGNLTVDMGPTGKYPSELTVGITPKVIDWIPAGKRQVILIEGAIGNVSAVRAGSGMGLLGRDLEFRKISDRLAAVVIPRRRAVPEATDLYLIDRDGSEDKVMRE